MHLVQAVPWAPLAVLAYLAAITVGTMRMRGLRVNRIWHHLLFIVTVAVTVVAAVATFTLNWRGAIFLVLALVPLVLLPVLTVPVRRRRVRHVVLGLFPAPLYLVALALWVAQR